MKQAPRRLVILSILALLVFGGLTFYRDLLKKQENNRKIEEYKKRMSYNKRKIPDLDPRTRVSHSRPAPSPKQDHEN